MCVGVFNCCNASSFQATVEGFLPVWWEAVGFRNNYRSQMPCLALLFNHSQSKNTLVTRTLTWSQTRAHAVTVAHLTRHGDQICVWNDISMKRFKLGFNAFQSAVLAPPPPDISWTSSALTYVSSCYDKAAKTLKTKVLAVTAEWRQAGNMAVILHLRTNTDMWVIKQTQTHRRSEQRHKTHTGSRRNDIWPQRLSGPTGVCDININVFLLGHRWGGE